MDTSCADYDMAGLGGRVMGLGYVSNPESGNVHIPASPAIILILMIPS